MTLNSRRIITYFIFLASFIIVVDHISFSSYFKLTAVEVFQQTFRTPKAIATTSLVVLVSVLLFSTKIPYNIPQLAHQLFTSMNSSFKYRSRLNSKKSKQSRFALANGGELGGITNEGNTCFMNSVIQSLASSRHLLKFVDSYLYSEILVDSPTEGQVSLRSNTPKPELVFTNALKTMFDQVNGSYGTRGKEFSTKPLLNKMPNGPKQNFFSGYNQEDAQEFYQLVMGLVEKEFKSLKKTDKKDPSEKQESKFVDISSISNYTSGLHNLGQLGTVYVPGSQVEPNLPDSTNKVYPLELITPVDGISAERIGCLTCGEVGGIRYSVTSGLSLNLPNDSSYYSSFSLNGLLDNWITPEIIEDVNCNRCGLNQTKRFLEDKLASLDPNTINSKIADQFSERITSITNELEKSHITDEVFEKLTIKQMIKKSKKSKQIFLARPPPLLSIHINRSVFDPRTYSIVKNSSNVTFPASLDLSKYTAEPEDINMDARLSFRKQDQKQDQIENPNVSVSSPADLTSSPSSASSRDTDSENENEIQKSDTAPSSTGEEPTNPDLIYKLKAVISHYGTHNYGHYICYRKLRGTWWRISDESVYVVDEDEVLNGQGTFMIFYEYDDGFKENLQDVSDSEEEEEKDDEDNEQDNESGLQNQESEGSEYNLEPLTNSLTNVVEYDENYRAGEERVHL